MKFKVKALLSILVIAILSIFVVSCGENRTLAETTGVTFEDNFYKVVVSNQVSTYDLTSNIEIDRKADVHASSNAEFNDTLDIENLSLECGSNLIYLKLTHKKNESIYAFNIYRKNICTVSFNTNGGTAVDSISVEEGEVVEAPTSSKEGYSLSWDYDFLQPVTESMEINATWLPNEYKITINAPNTEHNNSEVDTAYGAQFELPNISKEGYEFIGWYDENDVLFSNTGRGLYDRTHNVTLTPKYSISNYTVNYVTNGGTNVSGAVTSVTILDVTELLPAEWINDEKVFAGWYDNSSLEGDPIETLANISANITLYAAWTDVVFTSNVSYYIDNVLQQDTDAINFKSNYSLISASKDDYVFLGWTLLDGTPVPSAGASWPYKADVRLYASFIPAEYEIHYVLGNGGTNAPANPYEFDVLDNIELSDAIPHENSNYVFDGWYLDDRYQNEVTTVDVSQKVGNTVVLYAKWRIISDITYNLGDGATCDSELPSTLEWDSSYELEAPNREGYNFNGYSVNSQPISLTGTWNFTEDVQIVANWTPVSYSINYYLGSISGNANNQNNYTIESDFELNAPIAENAIFLGWYDNPDFSGEAIDRITSGSVGPKSLYAKWKSVTIILNSDNGSEPISKDVIIGEAYNLPTPVKAGYEFAGWFNGTTLVSLTGVWSSEEGATLVASWEIISYTITYDVNDEASEPVELTYDANTIVTLPTPTREGYMFGGWTADGEIILRSVSTKGMTGNRTYTAVWYSNYHNNFAFELVDGGAGWAVVGYTGAPSSRNIEIPLTYNGLPVVSIEARAFATFSKEFAKSSYARGNGTTVTILIPTSVKFIGAYAFEGIYGMGFAVYSSESYYPDYEEWDETAVFGAGNKQVRDCIFGIRPAVGWSRYSHVPIPEGYNEKYAMYPD